MVVDNSMLFIVFMDSLCFVDLLLFDSLVYTIFHRENNCW